MFKSGDRVYIKTISCVGVIVSTFEDIATIKLDDYPEALVEFKFESLELIGLPRVPVKHGWLIYKQGVLK